MQQQDHIRDDHGVTYRVGTLLGRGLFANTYTSREQDGKEWVIKTSLTPQDFPPDAAHLVKISRAILDEQWQILSRKPSPHILAPVRNFIAEDGRYCLVYPRNDVSGSQQLGQLQSVQDILRFIIRCTQALSKLPSGLCPHGNLHPNNIFWGGQQILFMDPLTPLLRIHHSTLLANKGISLNTPPEYRSLNPKAKDWSPSISTDTFQLCLLMMGRFIRGIEPELIENGWSKVLESNLLESLELFLEQNPSTNSHFHNRVSRQLVRVLDRGVSRSYTPSPPYRFNTLRDFQQRLQSVTDLINPSISKVGPILFSGPLGTGQFDQDDEVSFSCSIYTTPILEDHEDITCGTIILDLDKDQQRVDEYELWVEVNRLHGGRLRFQFGIDGLAPGNYGLILGFRVNGSIALPQQAKSQFQMNALAGYEPVPTVPPKALQFPESKYKLDVGTTNENEPVSYEEDVEPAVHPLLEEVGTVTKIHSNSIIKIAKTEEHRPQMTLPDAEHAHLSDILEPIHIATLEHPNTPPSSSERSVPKNTAPTLRVITNEAPQLVVKELHHSPFSVEIESLIEQQVMEFDSIEESFADELSEVPEYTDGFSESIQSPESSEEYSESPQELSSKISKIGKPVDDEVHDVIKETVLNTIARLQDDPFAFSIIVLIGLIFMLGLVILLL